VTIPYGLRAQGDKLKFRLDGEEHGQPVTLLIYDDPLPKRQDPAFEKKTVCPEKGPYSGSG